MKLIPTMLLLLAHFLTLGMIRGIQMLVTRSKSLLYGGLDLTGAGLGELG